MHARVTKYEGTPDKIEAGIKLINEVIVTGAKKIPGFKGGYWLMDRATGKGFSVTLFESEAALKASDAAAAQLRSQASSVAKITGIETYEVIAQVEPALATR